MIQFDWTSIKTWAGEHRTVLIGLGLFALLVIVAMYMTDCGENWAFNHSVNKQKQVIANNIDTIKNANVQIANLEQQKAAAAANVNAAVADYQRQVYGLDNAKAETNQALANLNSAMKANANIDATADDVLKALDKLNN
jgi:prefoldin subunit 5